MASDTEITKVRIVIRHLLWQIREIRNDRDAAWKWVNRFANTLQYQELEQDPDQYALAILAEARSFNDQQRRKGQMLGVRKQLAKEGVTNPTQEQLDEKWLEMYGQENSPQDAPNGNGEVNPEETQVAEATAPSAGGSCATNEARQSQGRTGGSSARMAKVAQPPVRSLRLPTWDEFVAFIDQQGFDYTDARQWWEMTMVDREGNDRYGKPIGNWKAALKRFCAAKLNNRRTA